MAVSAEFDQIDNRPAFCLVGGRGFAPWHWKMVQDELKAAGWDSIAPNLPIENPKMSLDDHARILRQAQLMSGAKEFVDVPHSWALNVILRAVELTVIKKMIALAGALHPATFPPSMQGAEPLLERTIAYAATTSAQEQTLDDEMGGYVFFQDVQNEQLKRQAIQRLRRHPRRTEEPQLESFPDIPMEYVVLTKDHTVVPQSQRELAKALGVEPVDFESGHAPMLSRPKELARLLIELANKD